MMHMIKRLLLASMLLAALLLLSGCVSDGGITIETPEFRDEAGDKKTDLKIRIDLSAVGGGMQLQELTVEVKEDGVSRRILEMPPDAESEIPYVWHEFHVETNGFTVDEDNMYNVTEVESADKSGSVELTIKDVLIRNCCEYELKVDLNDNFGFSASKTLTGNTHDFGDWYEVDESQAGAAGMMRRDCAKCGGYETDGVPALPSDPTDPDDPTGEPDDPTVEPDDPTDPDDPTVEPDEPTVEPDDPAGGATAEPKDDLPQTGDRSNLAGFTALLLGCAAVGLMRRRRA